jgi:hypothetical protein
VALLRIVKESNSLMGGLVGWRMDQKLVHHELAGWNQAL